VEALIETALAELAREIGADRAYLATPCSPPQIYTWSRDGTPIPQAWLAQAHCLAAELGPRPNGVTHIPNVGCLPAGRAKDTLLDAGVSGWACVTPDSPANGVLLAFDSLIPGAMTSSDEVSLLRMAFDAMAGAVHREALEAERSRLADNLQKARRMETVGAFASGIAHNFNNIIGAILGYTEMAQSQAKSSRLKANIAGIHSAAQRAHDLVEQILAFGRRRDVSQTPVTLDRLLAESCALLGAALPSQVQLGIRSEHGSASISGEAAQLQQVILNLCTNAAQAMDGCGSIVIETRVEEATKRIQLSHGRLPRGAYCVIAVKDHGRGMSEMTAKRVFEPFFTTRAAGNGLGLATVREIVSDHKGAIDVHSTPRTGTCFEVWLPCITPLDRQQSVEEKRLVERGQGETVLLVAEGREWLLRNEETLAALGYEPVGFVSLNEALAACRAKPDRFDVALVMQTSPDDTLATAAALHQALPHVPVLLATSPGDDMKAEALMKAGVFELVGKPLSSAELASVLARCVARTAVPAPRALSA
jgi:signal transduction histidine kinase/ActR/RegA family two-component response regulator